ncbi:MAG TPA: asparagine synthase (glutamine-hydrolyzing) [Methylomirabilota bacterium]|nr:asparagine synthase (glutamine-hydrolyzing) [Methylomirabilota bacterium]
MCGIAGVAFTDPRHPVDRELLVRMTSVMRHRGPDADGFHFGPGVGLGHRRLSIIDLASGDQPIYGEDRSCAVILNGEIYNFQEFQRELSDRGHVFKTRSDTESIVHAYEEWGVDCVARLRGMFAFALWDDSRRRLLLGRDRPGKKPLYYHADGDRLVFASEIKGLLQDPGIKRRLSLEALSDYLSFGNVPSPNTVFQDIHQIPAGHFLVWERGQVRVQEYWDVAFRPTGPARPEEALEAFAPIFDEAVKIRMVADVPLGAFLSGGIDSSAVVASMARQSERPVVTTSVGFTERTHSELEHARLVARSVGSEHHEVLVRPKAVEDLPRLVWHLDQPFADSSALPTYYVSKAAREHVTVALSGDGGDEVFAGYQRRYGVHRLESRLRRLLPESLRRGALARLGRVYPRAEWIPRPLRWKLVLLNLGQSFEHAYFNDLSLFLEDEKEALCSPEFLEATRHHDPFHAFARHFGRVRDADPLSRVLYVDFKTWLHNDILVKVDRMSMACSLEVRAPLLDHKVVEFAATLPPELKYRGSASKFLLKRHVSARLPALDTGRAKQGFELPLAAWLRGELRDLARDLLFSTRAAQRGYVRPETIKRIWDGHQRGLRNHASQIWALMVLELWLREFMDTA